MAEFPNTTDLVEFRDWLNAQFLTGELPSTAITRAQNATQRWQDSVALDSKHIISKGHSINSITVDYTNKEDGSPTFLLYPVSREGTPLPPV